MVKAVQSTREDDRDDVASQAAIAEPDRLGIDRFIGTPANSDRGTTTRATSPVLKFDSFRVTVGIANEVLDARSLVERAGDKISALKHIARREIAGDERFSLADVISDASMHPTLRYESARMVSEAGLLSTFESLDLVVVNERCLDAITKSLSETDEFFTATHCVSALHKALEDARLRNSFGKKAEEVENADVAEAVKRFCESVNEIFVARWSQSEEFKRQIVSRLLTHKAPNSEKTALSQLSAEKAWSLLTDGSSLEVLHSLTTVVGQALYDCKKVFNHTAGYSDLKSS
ncbi:MAG: hypothetical protein KDD56_06065 [Bdellovibrionales bacterium]|nr:hypothetical protein [Bdellovibrionales bacterium]